MSSLINGHWYPPTSSRLDESPWRGDYATFQFVREMLCTCGHRFGDHTHNRGAHPDDSRHVCTIRECPCHGAAWSGNRVDLNSEARAAVAALLGNP